jgi:hypothetical protein
MTRLLATIALLIGLLSIPVAGPIGTVLAVTAVILGGIALRRVIDERVR